MRARLMWAALALTACAVRATPAPEVEVPASLPEPEGAAGGEQSAGALPGPAVPDAEDDEAEVEAGSVPTAPIAIRLPADVERAVDDAVYEALDRRQLAGAVIAIGRRDGLAFLRAYGVRASDPSIEPNDVDTIYDLASLTKPIATTTALAILAERGALAWDDPVARFLPAFAAHGKARVTIRHLLHHTGGMPAVDPLRAYDGEDRAASIARILALPPVARPGERTLYSDLGFVVLGEVVAAAAGEPLDAFVAREILAPLAMRSSGFRPAPALVPRVAPTERAERRGGAMIRGDVHDPRAWRLGGVAGNAGLFASAPDLARFARAMLGEGELDGARILSPESVRALVTPERLPGGLTNGLGWDMRSAGEARAGGGMSDASYGHLGWTGTAIRIDPRLDVFAIVLSNDVHPDGHGDVRPLAAALERIVADAAPRMIPPPRVDVGAGIDALMRSDFEPLRGASVVLVTHDAARARDGRRSLDVLAASDALEVLRVLAPEHGLGVDREGHVGDARDARTGLPALGLFGATRRPTDAMLEGADTLVIDLVDVGARFYTYASTMHEALVAAAARPGLRVVVLDRAAPLGGAIVEGPLLDAELRSFVNHHPLPLRHGLTLGELARLLDAELGLGLGERLVVVRAEGWSRARAALEIGARWTPPSPNLPDAETALLYPAVALLEGADVSVGRGTTEPFRVIGAPWMSPERVLAALSALRTPGVAFEEARFTPRSARHRGRACRGVRVLLRDPSAYRAADVGLAIVRAVLDAHRDRIDLERVLPLVGSRRVLDALAADVPLEAIVAMAREDAAAFEARRAPYLLY
jgi:uncharacterized protein YbbC (DUF1343 family)